MDNLRFRCKSCERKLHVPPAAAGMRIRCPDCGTEQNAPHLPDQPADQQAPGRPGPTAFAARESVAEGEFHYEAFISYRHVEPDRKWAMWLHTALETYHVPRKLAGKRGLPLRLRHVFRDEEELHASADLNAEIESALKDSRFLIVVCSPRTPASEWVNKEVVRFREMGRHDQILALLIEGEPGEAFPRSLREIRRTLVDSEGLVRDEIEEVEPLAADVRPIRREPVRQVKRMAKLRMLACLLGVRFDDLQQRDGKRRTRKMRMGGALMGLLLLVMFGLAATAIRQMGEAEKARARLAELEANIAAERRPVAPTVKQVANPVFSPPGGIITGPMDVKVACDTDGARIHYTTDGRDPTKNSPVVTGRIPVAPGATLRAKAYLDGWAESAVMKASYTARKVTLADIVHVRDSALAAWENAKKAARGGGMQEKLKQGQTLFRKAQAFYDQWEYDDAKPYYEKLAAVCKEMEELAVARQPALDARKGADEAIRALDALGAGNDPKDPWNKLKTEAQAAFNKGDFAGAVRLWKESAEKARNELAALTRVVEPKTADKTVEPKTADKTVEPKTADKTVKNREPPAGRVIMTLKGHTKWVNSVAFSPDGKRIASGSNDNTAKIWDVATGREVMTLKGHTDDVNSVAFSRDGKRIASASEDKTVRIWDTSSGREVMPLKGYTQSVSSVAFSPDEYIASGSDDETVKVWDAATGLQVMTLKGHKRSVTSVAFSPDGKHIASGSWDKTVKIWDAATGKEVMTYKGHMEWVTSVAFSPDGKRIASGCSRGSLHVWEAATGKEVMFGSHAKDVTSVAFSPDGKRIASGSDDKTVKIWDVATGREVMRLKGHTKSVTSVAFSPDGKHIASGSSDKTVKIWEAVDRTKPVKPIASGGKGKTVKIREPAAGRVVMTLKGHTSLVRSVAFCPDGKRIASASADGTVKIWDAATGKEVMALKGHTDSVLSVAFSPDGKRIASGGGPRDKTVKVWDVATGREVITLKGHTKVVCSVAFSPDGKRIASGSWDKSMKIWDTATGREVMMLKEATPVSSVAFSPDGKHIASGGSHSTVKIWDAARYGGSSTNGREIMTFKGHTDQVHSVAFSPDGKRIASGSGAFDKTVKVWDAATGREVMALKGHTRTVLSVAFSPDGKRIASGSGDGAIKIWDAASGREVMTLKGGRSVLYSVAFSPDGKRIASGSGDGTVKIWEVDD